MWIWQMVWTVLIISYSPVHRKIEHGCNFGQFCSFCRTLTTSTFDYITIQMKNARRNAYKNSCSRSFEGLILTYTGGVISWVNLESIVTGAVATTRIISALLHAVIRYQTLVDIWKHTRSVHRIIPRNWVLENSCTTNGMLLHFVKFWSYNNITRALTGFVGAIGPLICEHRYEVGSG